MASCLHILLVASYALSSYANEYCKLAVPGHPTINFNTLTLSGQDYAIGSHVNDGYDYVINVCSQLNYQDETCHSGSAVCERHKRSDLATNVLGYTGSTALTWADPDGNFSKNSSIVMDLTGEKCKANNNETYASTKIHLHCSNKEFLMLENEAPALCQIELLFFTAQACGSPRYSCFNGTKCIPSDDYTGRYGTYDECAAECGVTPTRYACIVDKEYGPQCTETENGKFDDYETCSINCATSSSDEE